MRNQPMKYLKEITIIAAVSFLGELIGYLIPLPIPGSIYGLVIMFILLLTGVIKVTQVKKTGDFLLSFMPLMFISPCVSLIEKFDDCKSMILPVLITATVSTFAVMAVTALVSQAIIKNSDKKKENDNA